MELVDKLVTRARYRTGNKNYTYDPTTGAYTAGLSTETFLEALNDAQDHLQSKLITYNTNLFLQAEAKALVQGTQDYTLTKRVFGATGIRAVFYNSNNNSTDYDAKLRKGEPMDFRYYEGVPQYYIPYSEKVALVPVPSVTSGYVKVVFHEELDDLDIARAKVTSGATATISLEASPVPDAFEIGAATYVCISDKFGEPVLRNGVVSSYNSGTRQLVLAANITTYLVTGKVIGDIANCYLTVGKHTTTRSKLPDVCERYLRTFVQKRVLQADKDNTAIEEDAEMVRMEEEILEFYNDETPDVDEFPILDPEVLL